MPAVREHRGYLAREVRGKAAHEILRLFLHFVFDVTLGKGVSVSSIRRTTFCQSLGLCWAFTDECCCVYLMVLKDGAFCHVLRFDSTGTNPFFPFTTLYSQDEPRNSTPASFHCWEVWERHCVTQVLQRGVDPSGKQAPGIAFPLDPLPRLLFASHDAPHFEDLGSLICQFSCSSDSKTTKVAKALNVFGT